MNRFILQRNGVGKYENSTLITLVEAPGKIYKKIFLGSRAALFLSHVT